MIDSKDFFFISDDIAVIDEIQMMKDRSLICETKYLSYSKIFSIDINTNLNNSKQSRI